MAKKIFVIDDLRIFAFDAEYARNSTDGTRYLNALLDKDGELDELWLDHDLGWNGAKFDDIRPVVAWMEELAFNGIMFNIGLIVIHTANPAAVNWMKMALEPYYEVRVADANDYLADMIGH